MVKALFHFCHSLDSAFSETLESESDRGPLTQLTCSGIWVVFSWVIASHVNRCPRHSPPPTSHSLGTGRGSNLPSLSARAPQRKCLMYSGG